jgi:hypothetical protein
MIILYWVLVPSVPYFYSNWSIDFSVMLITPGSYVMPFTQYFFKSVYAVMTYESSIRATALRV